MKTLSAVKQMTDKPRIYVACLASYNNGCLHGEWLDATQDPDELLEEIAEILQSSDEEQAEEFAIFDFDFFGEATSLLGEYTPIEEVSQLAQLIEKHGESFASFVSYLGEIVDEDEYLDRFVGHYASVEDFAAERIDDDFIDDLPYYIEAHLDFEGLGLDLLQDYTWSRSDDGGIFVYA